MSSGNSSATTTTMNSQGFPVIIPQNCSNKIAVAPLPQKKISYRKDDKESHRNFQRSSIGPNSSPYQITTGYLPTSKSANRLYRTSNEVVIDGHTPTPIGDEPTGLRVAQLESKVEELQRMTSKQNFMFTTSTPVTNDALVKELISKDERIGQLQARIQFLSSEKEQQKIIYEKEREEWKKETENSRKMFLKHKEKIQKLQKDLEFCENHWKETEKQKNDEILQNQEKLHEKDNEIRILKEKILESTTKFSKQISEFEITMNLKNEKIIEMESLVAQMKIDKNSNMKKMMTPISGVETLSEMEDLTDVEDNFPTILPNRNENNTPNSRYSVTPSTTSEKYSTNLPSSFNQLFRTHFRRTQIVHDLTNKISEANLKILIGKNLDAEKILRYTTDTDAEDSESLVSEAPASSLRMTIPTAEKYLRKECDMLERTEKKLFDIRRQYLDVCKETNFANKYQNFNSTK
uniref:Uncharacterized protein n=1 Tax=Panagrolaimus sp. JU765 TaxID=591449 RepID=A0AC34RBL2_9BILA